MITDRDNVVVIFDLTANVRGRRKYVLQADVVSSDRTQRTTTAERNDFLVISSKTVVGGSGIA